MICVEGSAGTVLLLPFFISYDPVSVPSDSTFFRMLDSTNKMLDSIRKMPNSTVFFARFPIKNARFSISITIMIKNGS